MFQVFGDEIVLDLADSDPDPLLSSLSTPEVGTARKPDLTYCHIRSSPSFGLLDYVTLFYSLFLPLSAGPAPVLLLCLLAPCSSRSSPPCSCLLLTAGLLLVYVATYSVHLLLATYLDLSTFMFLLVKYTLSFTFVLLVPIGALCCLPDIRQGIREVWFRSTVNKPTAGREEEM